MLLVVGPAQAAGQFQIRRDVVIGLAEPGIGIEHVRILAQEIIVALDRSGCGSDWDRYIWQPWLTFGPQSIGHVGIRRS